VPQVDVKAEFVMAAVKVPDKGVPCADYSGGAEPFQTAHRPQSGFQTAVICFDPVFMYSPRYDKRLAAARRVLAAGRAPGRSEVTSAGAGPYSSARVKNRRVAAKVRSSHTRTSMTWPNKSIVRYKEIHRPETLTYVRRQTIGRQGCAGPPRQRRCIDQACLILPATDAPGPFRPILGDYRRRRGPRASICLVSCGVMLMFPPCLLTGTVDDGFGCYRHWGSNQAGSVSDVETMVAGGPGGVGLASAVDLRAAASDVVIPTIRMVAADLAERADFDLDSVDELRIAVHETCALLVRIAASDARLRCRFCVWPQRVQLAAEVDIDDMSDPLPVGSIGWWVLNCFADEVNALVLPAEPGQHGRVCLALVKDSVIMPRP
jgi:serine/threonine-protein kinase RsbW